MTPKADFSVSGYVRRSGLLASEERSTLDCALVDMVLQDGDGQIALTHSISAGLE